MTAWAVVTGVAMAKSGLSLTQVVGLSIIGFAGAAQLAALPLLVAGAPAIVSIVTALMVNLRFVIYSAGLAPSLRSLPLGQRMAAGYLVSDFGFVLFMRGGPALFESPYRVAYYFGVSSLMAIVWHVAALVGVAAATRIPTEWGLDFAGTLALVALLVPMLVTRPAVLGAITAATGSLLLRQMPLKTGIVLSILAGMAVAVAVDRKDAAR
jgi:predicted branched-subunit amino acid permease